MENNTNKTGVVWTIIIVLVILVGAGSYLYYTKALAPTEPVAPAEETEGTLASNCGLIVESPAINSAVSFPLTVTGRVDNTNAEETGCAWTMFEGQAGAASLYYETKDGWSLATDTEPIEVENWMSLTSNFSVTLNFNNAMEDLPSGYNFKIVLAEEDVDGDGNFDSLEIPVVLR